MTITFWELFESTDANVNRDIKNSKNLKEYMAKGDAGEDEYAIINHLIANVPIELAGLSRDDVRAKRAEAEDHWLCEVEYASTEIGEQVVPNPGQGTLWSIKSGSGTTTKILTSADFIAESVHSDYPHWQLATAPANRSNHKYLLNWEMNEQGGTVAKGIDRNVGGVELGARISVTDGNVNAGYLVNAAEWAALNAVNALPIFGFAARTLRLTSFSAQQRKGNESNPPNWEISFAFDYSPEVDIEYGTPGQASHLTITKPGQYLLDILLDNQKPDPATPFVIPDVIRLAVHRLYPEIDYASELLI